MPPINWRTGYDDALEIEARDNTVIHFNDVSLTQQHFAKDANLNTIMKRFGVTDGAFPPAALDPRFFGDFTDAIDFREHLDRVRNAVDRFNALPADLRSQFNNDPILLHDWVTDPANANDAVELGLLAKKPAVDRRPQQVQDAAKLADWMAANTANRTEAERLGLSPTPTSAQPSGV